MEENLVAESFERGAASDGQHLACLHTFTGQVEKIAAAWLLLCCSPFCLVDFRLLQQSEREFLLFTQTFPAFF
jgi:hypothetical protein